MRWWFPVVIYMAAIFYFSSLPDVPAPEEVPDVSLHAVAYFGLMLVTLRAVARGRLEGVTLSALAVAWIITFLYGISDEWHQSFVPGRVPDVRDVVANGVGAFAAGVCAKAWVIIRRL
jgi:VanZ family protein